jgi:glutamate synthase (ferredoxin)
MEMVALETLEDDDLSRLKRLIKNHSMYTNSPLAKDFWMIGKTNRNIS